MKAAKRIAHTPGPWRVHFNVPTAIVPGHIIKTEADPQSPIASLWIGGGSKGVARQEANARLIAAAPELLATCQRVLSSLLGGGEMPTVQEIDAVIHKAEGRSP